MTRKASRKASRKSSRKVVRKASRKVSHRRRKLPLKLIKIVRSPLAAKKYRAFFNNGKHTDFGAKGYQNYGGVGTERHLDEERKKRYIERHKKNEDWKNPKTAGTLSRYVLWNKQNFRSSVQDYKKRFNL